MLKKSVMSLALAAGCVLALGAAPAAQADNLTENQLITNGPQASRGDFGDWSARRNVAESSQYDRLLETNMAFRHNRERKECGSITDQQMHQQCLASFRRFEPGMSGSSEQGWRNRTHRGAGY